MSYIITCIDKDAGIGLNNNLPWKETEDGKNDMKMFRDLTTNNAIIFGYNTYKSIGKPLPKRLNIVVTHSHYDELKQENTKGLQVFKTLQEAVTFGKQYEFKTRKKCFICGGEKIYNSYLESYRPVSLYITILDESYDCDTFFPLNKLPKEKKAEDVYHKMICLTYI